MPTQSTAEVLVDSFILTDDERILIGDALRGVIVRYRAAAMRFQKAQHATLAAQHEAIAQRAERLRVRIER